MYLKCDFITRSQGLVCRGNRCHCPSDDEDDSYGEQKLIAKCQQWEIPCQEVKGEGETVLVEKVYFFVLWLQHIGELMFRFLIQSNVH